MMAVVALLAFLTGVGVTILVARTLVRENSELLVRCEWMEREYARVVAELVEQESRRSRVHPMTDEAIIIAAREFLG